MTTFIDKNGNTARIGMYDCNNGLSWEKDFFTVGGLDYDEERDAYMVDDVYYLAEQADDWHKGIGDYIDDFEGEPGHTPDDREYIVIYS